MKKLVFMALAMVLSFTGFAQTEELTSTSNNSDLKTASSSFDFNIDNEIKEVSLINSETEETTTLSGDNDDFSYGYRKNDWYVGGSIGFNSTKQGDSKQTGWNIMPSVGTSITDDIVLYGSLGLMNNKVEIDNDEIDNVNTFMAGVGAKWFCTPEKRFSPYVGAGVNYLSINYDVSDFKETGFEFGLGAGITYWASDKFVLGANVGLFSYSSVKADFDDADAVNSFNFGLNTKQIDLGFAYRFGGGSDDND